jgi:hypothetical protein
MLCLTQQKCNDLSSQLGFFFVRGLGFGSLSFVLDLWWPRVGLDLFGGSLSALWPRVWSGSFIDSGKNFLGNLQYFSFNFGGICSIQFQFWEFWYSILGICSLISWILASLIFFVITST